MHPLLSSWIWFRWTIKVGLGEGLYTSFIFLYPGFLALQTTISQVATAIAMPSQCGISKQIKSTFVQKQPVMEVNQSFASTIFQLFTAMYMVWAFAPQFQTTLFHIVEEKESMIKVLFNLWCDMDTCSGALNFFRTNVAMGTSVWEAEPTFDELDLHRISD